MNEGFYPVSVIQAVPHQGGIRFLHLRDWYDVPDMAEEIWAVLARCNGYNSAKQIAREVSKQQPTITATAVEDIIVDLTSMGVLVDGRKLYRHHMQFTNNPALYGTNLSDVEVARYTRSPRLSVKEGEYIPLSTQDGVLAELARTRRSCRSFADEPLSLDEVSVLCTTAYSLIDHTSPSAGGLYPLKIYLIVKHSGEDLRKGYYEYDPAKHRLIHYNTALNLEILTYAFNSESLLHGAPVILVIAADMDRHPGKYANRGYRYTLLEAGHVAQNVHLVGAEHGLSTLEYGGFLDGVLANELGMQEDREVPLITIAIGKSTPEPETDDKRTLRTLQSALVGPTKPIRFVGPMSGGRPHRGETFQAVTARYVRPATHLSQGDIHYGIGTASSDDLARIKAIAEAYERYVSGDVRIDRTARAFDLTEPWLDPRQVAPLTPVQYATMPYLQPFDPTAEWQWVEGRQPHDGSRILVPIDLVFYPLDAERLGRRACCATNSSGVAAYTNPQEATRRGLLELIERDAIMRNWFGQRSPAVIPHTSLPTHWRQRAEYWVNRGRSVYVLDLSSRGTIVVNVAIVSETDYPCFVSGAAASERSFEEAVRKAFQEAELSVLQSLKRTKREPRISPEEVHSTVGHATLYSYPDYLDSLRWLWSGNEVDALPTATRSYGELVDLYQPTVVAFTRPDSPLHVVRVLSPQLVPMNFGFGNDYFSHPAAGVAVTSIAPRMPHYFT